jgi:Helix-turn-helix domain
MAAEQERPVDTDHPPCQKPKSRSGARTADRGSILRQAREAMGLTQAQVGELTHRSASVISRYETGARVLDGVDALQEFSTVLKIPPQLLGLAAPPFRLSTPTLTQVVPSVPSTTNVESTGPSGSGENGGRVRRRELLAAGLTGVAGAAILGSDATGARTAPPVTGQLESLLLHDVDIHAPAVTIAALTRSLHIAQAQFQACRYQQLASHLPGLVATATATRDTATGHERELCAAMLSAAYALASELSVKIHKDAMAWVAADRALTAARSSGDTIAIATASRAVAVAMRRGGHYDAATQLLVSTAQKIDIAADDTPSRVLAAYGLLLCTAAYSSAQNNKPGAAIDLITEAEHTAARIGDTRADHAVFGPTGVAVYRISIHTAFGQPGTALGYARAVTPSRLPTAERRARYCIDTARAWEQHGDTTHAYQALVTAERHAPEEIQRPSVQTLINCLLYAPGTPPAGLRELATRSATT